MADIFYHDEHLRNSNRTTEVKTIENCVLFKLFQLVALVMLRFTIDLNCLTEDRLMASD